MSKLAQNGFVLSNVHARIARLVSCIDGREMEKLWHSMLGHTAGFFSILFGLSTGLFSVGDFYSCCCTQRMGCDFLFKSLDMFIATHPP